jgi:hypothetical protein
MGNTLKERACNEEDDTQDVRYCFSSNCENFQVLLTEKTHFACDMCQLLAGLFFTIVRAAASLVHLHLRS